MDNNENKGVNLRKDDDTNTNYNQNANQNTNPDFSQNNNTGVNLVSNMQNSNNSDTNYYYDPNVQNNQNFNQPPQNDGLSIAALVLGIVSVLGFCCCTPIGIICGVLAIVFGAICKSKNTGNQGFALAGIITGAVGAVGSVIWICVGQQFNQEFLEKLQDALESAIYILLF